MFGACCPEISVGSEYSLSSSYMECWNQDPQNTEGQVISGRQWKPAVNYPFQSPFKEWGMLVVSHCRTENVSGHLPNKVIGDTSSVLPGENLKPDGEQML